jgi:hypothetical protein
VRSRKQVARGYAQAKWPVVMSAKALGSQRFHL